MDKNEVREKLDKALHTFSTEVESALEASASSFGWREKEEIKHFMKLVFYTLSDFQEVIQELAD